MYSLLNSLLKASRSVSANQLSYVAKLYLGEWNHQILSQRMSRLSTTQSTMSSTSNLFKGKEDRYKGIIVDSEDEKCDVKAFSKRLEDSLKEWSQNEFRGIWFKVHLNQSEWVPLLIKSGFKYHHAREEYVMLYMWLSKTENVNIPSYAHTLLGVGAVVINDNNEILVVQEKYTILNKRHYKLPGGYVEPGENIVDAAIREVLEETNISTEFLSMLSLRHAHGVAFNCSDIYIVVCLKAVSNQITKCERELVEAKWMVIDEFLKHPEVIQLNKFFVRKYLEHKKNGIKINCFHGMYESLNKPYTLYSVTKDDTEEESTNITNVKNKS